MKKIAAFILSACFALAETPAKQALPAKDLEDKDKAELGIVHTRLILSRLAAEQKLRIADKARIDACTAAPVCVKAVADAEDAIKARDEQEKGYAPVLSKMQKEYGARACEVLGVDYKWDSSNCPKEELAKK